MPITRPHLTRAAVVAAVLVTILDLGTGTAQALPIEDGYTARGPFTTLVYDKNGDETTDSCTTGTAPGGPYTFAYPEDLDAGGDHPIVVWGNGANVLGLQDPTCYYRPAFEHLASWGYVVVAPNQGFVADGTALVDALDTIVALNSDPASVFYGHLDTTEIAAVGHSAGADGAVRATIASGGAITSTVAISSADPDSPVFPWWWPTEPRPDTSLLTDPVLFVRGQCDPISTETGDREVYDPVPGPAAKATVRPDDLCPPYGWGIGASHNDMSNAFGYVTAWLEYTLRGASLARAAFVGSPPEIAANPHWMNWQSKNLP